MKAKLTIGPVLFHWPAEQWRDFYFRVADEMPVDRVYVGEVVCSKRIPFYEPHYAEVAERLKRAGKEVVFSTLAEVMLKRDRRMVEDLCGLAGTDLVEANDAAALFQLRGRTHAVGPYVNCYNEETLAHLASNGAVHVTLPPEMPFVSISALGQKAKKLKTGMEVQVYGRMPLALSARCYHARAHGRIKDNCLFVCGNDPDGMALRTIDGTSFLTVNGIQTLSYTILNLCHNLGDLASAGITHFRISPHSTGMTETAQTFCDLINKKISSDEADAILRRSFPGVPFSNGFYSQVEGYKWVAGSSGS